MRNKGFTLIELLVVVAIIGIISAIGVLAFNGYIERTNLTKEQNAELTAAMNAGPEAMKQFVDKYDKFFGGGAMDDVAERLDILIAKEDALIRKQEESKKAISDLTLE